MIATLRALLLAALGAIALPACGGENGSVDAGAVTGSAAKVNRDKRTARCDVVVDDVRTGSKALIQETFYWSSNADDLPGERTYFALPGMTDGRCTLAFFPESGTMVSCETDALSLNYVQSDRSGIKEFPNRNQLTFRLNGIHVTIEVTCS